MSTRGRGRGALGGPPRSVGSSKSPPSFDSTSSSSKSQILDIRITEVFDVSTFWAQIGTVKQLEDFDKFCISLSAQCEDNASVPRSSPLCIGTIVPVRDNDKPGTWIRALVTRILPDGIVEVNFSDTGKSGRVPVSDVCPVAPPLTLAVASQALQCSIQGLTMIEGDDSLIDEATSRFEKLVSLAGPHGMKAILHSICDDMPTVSVYTRYDGHWKSVGEILRMESLVLYNTSAPLTLDHLIGLPHPLAPEADRATPIDCKGDTSTLLDIPPPMHDFDINEDSFDYKPVSPVPISKDSFPLALAPIPTNTDPMSDSLMLTPPPESDAMFHAGKLPGNTPSTFPNNALLSDNPMTPTETPPSEEEASYVSLSPPPLISEQRASFSRMDRCEMISSPSPEPQGLPVLKIPLLAQKPSWGNEVDFTKVLPSFTWGKEQNAVSIVKQVHQEVRDSESDEDSPTSSLDAFFEETKDFEMHVPDSYALSGSKKVSPRVLSPIQTEEAGTSVDKGDLKGATDNQPHQTDQFGATGEVNEKFVSGLVMVEQLENESRMSVQDTTSWISEGESELTPRVKPEGESEMALGAKLEGDPEMAPEAKSEGESELAPGAKAEGESEIVLGAKTEGESELAPGAKAEGESEMILEVKPKGDSKLTSGIKQEGESKMTRPEGEPKMAPAVELKGKSELTHAVELKGESEMTPKMGSSKRESHAELSLDMWSSDHSEQRQMKSVPSALVESKSDQSTPREVSVEHVMNNDQLSGSSEQQVRSKPELDSEKKYPLEDVKNLDDSGSSDDEWDESLLPPRYTPLLSVSSEVSSNVTTPTQSPLKKPCMEKTKLLKKKNQVLHAQFEALMSTTGPAEQEGRGKKPNRGGKKNRYSNSASRRPDVQSWNEGFFDTPKPGIIRTPPSYGRVPPGGRGTPMVGGGPPRYKGQSRGRGAPNRDEHAGNARDNHEPPLPYRNQGYPTEQPYSPSQFQQGKEEEYLRGEPLSPGSQVATPKPEGISPEQGEKRVIGMTEDEIMNEYKWHSWKIENRVKTMMASLTSERVESFGKQIQELLSDTSAKKILSLQRGKPPLGIVLECILSGSRLVVEALESVIKSSAKPQVYKVLQSAISTAASDVSLGSAATDARSVRHSFCEAIGRLFMSASYSGNEEYSTAVGFSVKHCLSLWINCSTQVSELQQVASCNCFVALCENIGPTIDTSNKESLDIFFNGPVRAAILSYNHPKGVKEPLFDLALKRASKWHGVEHMPNTSTSQVAPLQPATVSQSQPATVAPSQPAVVSLSQPATVSPSQPAVVAPSQPAVVAPSQPAIITHPSYQSPVASPAVGSSYPSLESQIDLNTQQYLPNQQLVGSQSQVQYPQQSVQSPPTGRGMQFDGSHRLLNMAMSEQQRVLSPRSPYPTQYLSQQYRHDQLINFPQQPQIQEQSCVNEPDPYQHILEMLQSLGFPELLSSFKQHMIMDFVLDSDLPTVKECLKNAQMPLGAVVGIMTYLENRQRKKHSQRRPTSINSSSTVGFNPNPPIFQPSYHTGVQSNAVYSPSSAGGTAPPSQQPDPYYGPVAGVGYSSFTPVSPPPPQPYYGGPQKRDPPSLQLPPVQDVEKQQTVVQLPDSGGVGSGVTVRLPTTNVDWTNMQPQSPQDSKPNAQSGDGQPRGGFGNFTCILCHSSTHTTPMCDKRDNFFVHM